MSRKLAVVIIVIWVLMIIAIGATYIDFETSQYDATCPDISTRVKIVAHGEYGYKTKEAETGQIMFLPATCTLIEVQ